MNDETGAMMSPFSLKDPCQQCKHARLLHHNPEITDDTVCHARDCPCREFK